MMQPKHQALSCGFNAACQGKPMENSPKKKAPPPISVRLTEEERAQLEQAALGTSLSAHIRQCIFGSDVSVRKTRSRVATKDEQALARVLGQLGQSRIANNLNQLAKHANQGSLPVNEQTTAQIEEAYAHVRFMRDELVRALGLFEGKSQ